jgi:hypothetical protein
MRQDSVSRLERRTDLLISTLRSYLEAMGGSLKLVVEFEDEEPVALNSLLAEEPTDIEPSTGQWCGYTYVAHGSYIANCNVVPHTSHAHYYTGIVVADGLMRPVPGSECIGD